MITKAKERNNPVYETEEHQTVKNTVCTEFKKCPDINPVFVDTEYVLKSGRRADILVQTPTYCLDIEVVARNQNYRHYRTKKSDLHNEGVIDFWIYTDETLKMYFSRNMVPTKMMEDLQDRFGGLFFLDSVNRILGSVFYDNRESKWILLDKTYPLHPSILKDIERDYMYHKSTELYFLHDYYNSTVLEDVEESFNKIETPISDGESFNKTEEFKTPYDTTKVSPLVCKPIQEIPHPLYNKGGEDKTMSMAIELEDGTTGHIQKYTTVLSDNLPEYIGEWISITYCGEVLSRESGHTYFNYDIHRIED